jgi:adenylate cyclase
MTTGGVGDDIEVADATIEQALASNPGSAFVWYASGFIKVWSGRSEEALAHFEKALRLDPRSPDRALIMAGMGWSLFFLRRFVDALPVLKQALQLRPDHQGPLQALSAAYAHLGRLAEAREAYAHLEIPDTLVDIYRGADQRELIYAGLALARDNA